MQNQSLDLASYIAALPPQIKFDVFSSPWTTQALFRALSPLAQQYILRLLYVDEGISKGKILHLASRSSCLPHNASLCCYCCCYCGCGCRLYAGMGGARGGATAPQCCHAAGGVVCASTRQQARVGALSCRP
jgi:hypothetical protein